MSSENNEDLTESQKILNMTEKISSDIVDLRSDVGTLDSKVEGLNNRTSRNEILINNHEKQMAQTQVLNANFINSVENLNRSISGIQELLSRNTSSDIELTARLLEIEKKLLLSSEKKAGDVSKNWSLAISIAIGVAGIFAKHFGLIS